MNSVVGDLGGVSGCHGMTKRLAGFETCHFCRTDGEREYWITGMLSIRTMLERERWRNIFGVNDVRIGRFKIFF